MSEECCSSVDIGGAQGATHLLCVLLEEAELETLVQLQFSHVPDLVEVLPRRVELIQQTGRLEEAAGKRHSSWSDVSMARGILPMFGGDVRETGFIVFMTDVCV